MDSQREGGSALGEWGLVERVRRATRGRGFPTPTPPDTPFITLSVALCPGNGREDPSAAPFSFLPFPSFCVLRLPFAHFTSPEIRLG